MDSMDSNVPPPEPPSSSPPPPPTPPPVIPRQPYAPRPPRRGRGWKIAALILAVLLVLSLVANLRHALGRLTSGGATHRTGGPQLDEVTTEDNKSTHKIVVIPVEGIISSDLFDGSGYNMVDYIQDQLKLAEEDDQVKAVILKVNSPGGEVMAADDIHQAILDFQKKSGKPVLASMGSMAASGGYYVSAPCRWIVANELTLTGSIGVIMHSLNFRGLLDKVGVRPEVYKSGKFKDMLSATKDPSEVTPEERAMMQRLIDETFQKFKSVVADGRQAAASRNRDNPGSAEDKGQRLIPDWADYADGRVLSGKEAYTRGFVDELGSWDVAVKRTKRLAQIDRANLVEYHQRFDLSSLLRLFGKAEAPKIKMDLGLEAPKIKAGQLYFLSPTVVH